MLVTKLQIWLEPYLAFFGDNVWLQATVVIVGSLLVALIFDRVIAAALKNLISRTQFSFDEYLIDHLHRPIYFTLLLIGLALAVSLLQLQLGEALEQIIFSVLRTLVYIIWSLFLIRATRTLLGAIAASDRGPSAINPQTLPLFQNLALIAIVVISVYIIFTAWNVDMTAWLASAGIIGIAVGFAAKDTLANLFSGVFIMADAPYKIGDFVVLDTGERGEITHIGIRSTRMRTRDDVEVTVPNSVMGQHQDHQ